MAEILQFGGQKEPTQIANAREPNPRLVNILNELLNRAENGSLQSLIAVGITSDNGIVEGWSLDEENPMPYALIGALEVMKITLTDNYIE